jgi:ribosomal protein S21
MVYFFYKTLSKGGVNSVVEVRKKDNESTESLLRRFTKRVQLSGVLLEAKKGQYKEPSKSRQQRRVSALRRNKIRSKREYLKKIGKLEEIQDRRYHRSSSRG